MEVKLYDFPPHGDDRGQLIAIEENQDIPFDVKRIYYIYDTLPGVRRGFHAHRNLQQILICVSGSCKIHLDNGFVRCDKGQAALTQAQIDTIAEIVNWAKTNC